MQNAAMSNRDSKCAASASALSGASKHYPLLYTNSLSAPGLTETSLRDPKEMSRTSTDSETPMGRRALPWLLNLAKSSSWLSPAPACCRHL